MANQPTTHDVDENVDRKEHWNSADAQKRSLANLKPFGPGHRPVSPGRKKLSESERLFRAAGRRKVPSDPRNRSMLQLVVENLYIKACKGDVTAAGLILDRLFGRAVRSDELEMLTPPNIVVRVGLGVPRFDYDFSQLPDDLKPGT